MISFVLLAYFVIALQTLPANGYTSGERTEAVLLTSSSLSPTTSLLGLVSDASGLPFDRTALIASLLAPARGHRLTLVQLKKLVSKRQVRAWLFAYPHSPYARFGK